MTCKGSFKFSFCLAAALTFLFAGLSRICWAANGAMVKKEVKKGISEEYGNRRSPAQNAGSRMPGLKSPVFSIDRDDRISISVEERSLGDLLRDMAGQRIFEIRGPVPSGEPVTMSFSNLTLSEALMKLMQGYNYVLLAQENGNAPLLMVLGKTERNRSGDRSPVLASITRANPTADPRGYYVPPAVTAQPAFFPPVSSLVAAPGASVSVESPPSQASPGERDSVDQGGSGNGAGTAGSSVDTSPERQDQREPHSLAKGGDPNYKPGGPGYVPILIPDQPLE